jgi:5-methylcytosine-specific restriction endonuclease McrBC GTP-binding regulatory subunit McrB
MRFPIEHYLLDASQPMFLDPSLSKIYWFKKLQWMKYFMINEILERKNIKWMKSCMIDGKLYNFG